MAKEGCFVCPTKVMINDDRAASHTMNRKANRRNLPLLLPPATGFSFKWNEAAFTVPCSKDEERVEFFRNENHSLFLSSDCFANLNGTLQ